MNPAKEVLRALEDPSGDTCAQCGHEFSSTFEEDIYENEHGDYICLSCYEGRMDYMFDMREQEEQDEPRRTDKSV
jgi:hypothetical protein